MDDKGKDVDIFDEPLLSLLQTWNSERGDEINPAIPHTYFPCSGLLWPPDQISYTFSLPLSPLRPPSPPSGIVAALYYFLVEII